MRRVVTPLTSAVLAAVVLSACGSSGEAPVSVPHVKVHGPGSIVFVAGGPSHGLGVDNTDLLAATPNGHVRDLTSSDAAESDAIWSADGSRVVFTRQSTTGTENGAVTFRVELYSWAPGHGAPQRIASCEDFCSQREFAWSPDGRQVAFVSGDAAIEVMNSDGSGVRTVCDATRCGQGLAMPMWSPNGRKLVFSNEGGVGFGPGGPGPSGIWIANADGSGVEKLTQPNCNLSDGQTQGCALDTAPSWSPDGRLIAFSRQSVTMGSPPARPVTPGLKVMHADGSHIHGLCRYCGPGSGMNRNGHYLPLAWAPDGKSVASPGLKSFRITTLSGKTTTVRACSGSRCLYPGEFTWSPSGMQLAFIGPTNSVWVIGRDGTAMHRVAVGAQCCSFAWVGHVSPTGAKAIPKVSAGRHLHLTGTIAYVHPSDGTHSPIDLLFLGTAGTHASRVASIQGLDPSLSPDGRQIAFASRMATKNTNIYVADPNGKNVRTLTDFQGGASQPAWSPDGRTIAFTVRRGGSGGIGLVSAADGHVRRLTFDGTDPSWSPTGRELLFDRRLGPQEGAIFAINADGSGLRQITNLPG